jgi:uncharacterized protein
VRVAVIGTGISGMVSAHLLAEDHDLTVYEAGDYVGGHTHTVDVAQGGRKYALDTGFIVFNDWTYPNFIKLLQRLGVASKPSTMGFSVRCDETGLEYSTVSLSSLFAQRRNLWRPEFHRMLVDILRFFRHAKRSQRREDDGGTMAEFLSRSQYSNLFRRGFLLPMMSAIWSSEPSAIEHFPARYFLGFYKNHGLLNLWHRPQWRVIEGGSRAYIGKLTERYHDRIRLSTPVRCVLRQDDGVSVEDDHGDVERFDHVVIATHSDQALRILADPTERECDILGAIPYRGNDTVLHTDVTLLPRLRRAWASWNYHVAGQDQPMVTYNMNILQGIEAPETFCVSLNRRGAIASERILGSFDYDHPLFTVKGVEAQKRHAEISGVNRTHYCGAYWGYGFHEDGVNSALAACRFFEKDL